MYNRFISIDPGSNGAIAILEPNCWVKTMNIPDEIELRKIFEKDLDSTVVMIEQSNLFHGKSKAVMFRMIKLIRNQNMIISIAKSIGVPIREVHPKTWQKELKLNVKYYESDKDRKNRYKQMAQTDYPYISVTLKNADALLMLTWLYNKELGNI